MEPLYCQCSILLSIFCSAMPNVVQYVGHIPAHILMQYRQDRPRRFYRVGQKVRKNFEFFTISRIYVHISQKLLKIEAYKQRQKGFLQDGPKVRQKFKFSLKLKKMKPVYRQFDFAITAVGLMLYSKYQTIRLSCLSFCGLLQSKIESGTGFTKLKEPSSRRFVWFVIPNEDGKNNRSEALHLFAVIFTMFLLIVSTQLVINILSVIFSIICIFFL